MPKKSLSGGVVHDLPDDLKKALKADPGAAAAWESLTPVARNEWICWTTIVKKQETRDEHVRRVVEQLKEGDRRPCCWPGCPHRNTKAAKWFKTAPVKGNAATPKAGKAPILTVTKK